MRMRPFGRLLPLETARRRTLAAVRPVVGSERLALAAALGRVADETYRAPRPNPTFSRATWDGFAVRAQDTRAATGKRPVPLRVVDEVFAEGRARRPLRAGEAVAIATGGALPRGSDAIVIFEEADEHDGAIHVRRPVAVGDRVAEPGDDFPRGTVLLRRGEPLDAARLGALGAAGRADVRVRRRPVVSLLPNGNELRPLGATLARGAVHEINNLTLGALLTSNGAEVRAESPLPDDPVRIERALRAAVASSDLVVVTGGSSVGERDYLPILLPKLGKLLFHGVAVRPGKPTLVARTARGLILGMPGHPTSCLSNGFWLLLPVIRRLGGYPGPGWTDIEVELGAPAARPSPKLSTVVPLHVEGDRGYPTFRDSSAITSLSGANAFALLPPGAPELSVGQRLRAHRLLPPLAAL